MHRKTQILMLMSCSMLNKLKRKLNQKNKKGKENITSTTYRSHIAPTLHKKQKLYRRSGAHPIKNIELVNSQENIDQPASQTPGNL
jgi:hypothetical protein